MKYSNKRFFDQDHNFKSVIQPIKEVHLQPYFKSYACSKTFFCLNTVIRFCICKDIIIFNKVYISL